MEILEEFKLWKRLRYEQDGRECECDESDLKAVEAKIAQLKNSEKPNGDEPSDREGVFSKCAFALAANGDTKQVSDYENRVKGALMGRFAGCILGVPVEGYSIDRMEKIAKDGGTPFPPTQYWNTVERPDDIQYGVNKRSEYSFGNIHCAPVDDDITYTVLNMLLIKEYGVNYSVENVAEIWKKLLPYACTAEDCALNKLSLGCKGEEAAEGNPFVEWIGAAIRADAFGYVMAGRPRTAAKLCFNDAYLTHRRNGIYGEMFCASSIAAAFVLDNCLDALKEGLKCIPQNSRLADDLRWAFSYEGKLKDFRHAREVLDSRFSGMDGVHTNNNMCAIVFAVMLGENDFTKSIANAVAMGLDNDCTGATVGSLLGANVGINGIDEKWYKPFNDTVITYLKGYEKLSINSLIQDFVNLHEKYKGVKF